MLLYVGVDMRSYCLLLWSGHRVSLLVLLRARLELLLMRWIFHTVIGRLFWVTLALLLQVWGRSLLSLLVLFLRVWFWGHVKHLSIADRVGWRFDFLFNNLLLLVLLLLRAIFFHIDQRVFSRGGRDTVEPITQAALTTDERTLPVSFYLVFGRFWNKFCCSHILSIFKL